MKILKCFAITIIICISILFMQNRIVLGIELEPEVDYVKTFGGSSTDRINKVVPTNDGYIVVR